MKIVLASNFLNHHQIPFCEAMQKLADEFYFVATAAVPLARKELGYADANHAYDYVIRAYETEHEKNKALHMCLTCDVLITGSAPEFYLKNRLHQKKLTFRYSERIYKNPCKLYELPARAVKYFFRHGRHGNLYLLCASAYTAADYARTFTFLNKTYKWGYFTETKTYDVDSLMLEKQHDIPRILWVGRFLDLKHPDDAIRIAERLKKAGYQFELSFIGVGEMETQLRQMIQEKNLSDCVHFLGSMPPEDVRNHMEQANIYLFTSDRQEGWGAVLNESMNSGCAVVASHAIGSVPFLMRDNENGLIYRSGDVDMLYNKVKYLLDNPDEQIRLGKAAYQTVAETWSAEVAAKRLVELSEYLLKGEKHPDLFDDGPCSKAEIINERWF